jgi:hypothetical protein
MKMRVVMKTRAVMSAYLTQNGGDKCHLTHGHR